MRAKAVAARGPLPLECVVTPITNPTSRFRETALATDVRTKRRLAAVLAADVAGYSRLMGADEEGTHDRLQAHFRELVYPKIRGHRGRIVKNTGDGCLAEFASVVDAVRCAIEVQRGMADREPEVPEERQIRFRIGINLGDIIAEGEDIFGDGVNIAARLEALAEPGGICVSRVVRDQVRDRLDYTFEDMGEQQVKNIARPVRVYRVRDRGVPIEEPLPASPQPLPLPDKPSVAVLPFTNMSGDPEQEYFADGIVEEIITALSRIRWLFVIARNSSFTYKGQAVDVKQVGRELGVRYVLEGSVRKAGNRVRITAQLVDATTGNHVWAERYERLMRFWEPASARTTLYVRPPSAQRHPPAPPTPGLQRFSDEGLGDGRRGGEQVAAHQEPATIR
jgi:TolB-like protein/class 3 adenylate cyclase